MAEIWARLLQEHTIWINEKVAWQLAYSIQRPGAGRTGALNTVGALVVRASKCEVID